MDEAHNWVGPDCEGTYWIGIDWVVLRPLGESADLLLDSSAADQLSARNHLD